jgi:threonine synthase
MNSLRIEGQKTVGIEIVQQFDWEMPDWLVIPGGNLGNVSALAKGIDMLLELGLATRRPRIVCAQAQAANPLYLAYRRGFETYEPIAARPTLATAIQIGNPVSIEKAIDAIRRYDGIVEQASEPEIAEACARADRTGLFNCPHTGVALAAMEKLVARGEIRKRDRVVVISTAHGLKFVDFKVKYHEMRLPGIVSDLPNPPIELPARYDVVRDEMLRQIEARASGAAARSEA